MDYDIQILLDPSCFNELIGAWPELDIEPLYGWHVTLSIFNSDNVPNVISVFENLCGQWQLLSLISPAILLFPHAICLAITPVPELLTMHWQLETSLLAIEADVDPNYLSSCWIPHVTLYRRSHTSKKEIIDQLARPSHYQLSVVGVQLITVSENRIHRNFAIG